MSNILFRVIVESNTGPLLKMYEIEGIKQMFDTYKKLTIDYIHAIDIFSSGGHIFPIPDDNLAFLENECLKLHPTFFIEDYISTNEELIMLKYKELLQIYETNNYD